MGGPISRTIQEHLDRMKQSEKEPDPRDTSDSESGEGEHWIAGAVKKPGQLHRDLGVPQGQKIPVSQIEAAAKSSNPKLRQRAQFALNVRK